MVMGGCIWLMDCAIVVEEGRGTAKGLQAVG